MTVVLPWATLFVLLALAIARIPGALRGENRPMFYLLSLFTLDILISIEAPYLILDSWLGGFNLANLLLRYLVYATAFLLGIRIAVAFGSRCGLRAIRGPLGLAILAATALLTTVFFFATDTRGSSVGMGGLGWAPSLEAYAGLGRFYPGYVAACLVPGVWRTVRNKAPVLLRAASALLLLGLALLVLLQLSPITPAAMDWLDALVNYSTALSMALGLGGIWLSKSYSRRKARRVS